MDHTAFCSTRMPRLAVIFDANMYRTLGKPAFASLVSREAQHSAIGYASFWTCMELLAHMADSTDPDFGSSWSAIRRLVRHCTEYDGTQTTVRFIADSENILARTLFGRTLPERDEQAIRYGSLLGAICDAQTPDHLEPWQEDLQGIRDHVKASEHSFADAVFTHVIRALVPGATTWDALARHKPQSMAFLSRLDNPDVTEAIGALFAASSAAQLGIQLTADELRQHGARAAQIFPAPVRFYQEILRRIATTGYDMSKSKNANSVWDLQFAFSTSPHAVLGGIPLWVVSRDNLILTAADKAGSGKWFIHPDTYDQHISLGRNAFDALVAKTTPPVGRRPR